jgi:hypothetical protein
LVKAKALLHAGKRDKAVRRLRRIVCRYPTTKAAIEAAVILSVADEGILQHSQGTLLDFP